MVIPSTRPALGGREHPSVRSGVRAFWPRTRVRRPVDGARLLLASSAATALVLLAATAAGLLPALDRLLPGGAARTGPAGIALSVANGAASLAVLGILLAIAVDALRSRRPALTSAVLACALGVAASLLVADLAGLASGAAAALLRGPAHGSAGLPVTASVALVVGADLQRRRWLGPARLALAAAVACALLTGSLTVTSGGYAVLVGAAAGLAVRVAVGVVPSRPPEDVVRAVLAAAGWELTGLRPLEATAGRVRYAGSRPGAEDLQITVVDPDRRGIPFARRVWRLALLRTAAVGRPALSLRGQLERQALSSALARSAGVAVPRVLALLAAGPALVAEPLDGVPLAAADDPAGAGGAVAAMAALRRLHDAGLAHGALTADGVLLLPDGRAGFRDLGAAQPAATDLQRDLDVVALLAVTGAREGAGNAVAALRAGYRTDPATEGRLGALLQPLALPGAVRRAVGRTGLLADLRSALTAPGGGSRAAGLRLERLRPRTVVTVAAATLAAHILATQLSQVSLADALSSARPGWLAVAVAGSAVTYLGSALALQAFAPAALPLARTTLVQLASSFLTLVTPPAVGHIGLNIRYLHRAGVPTGAAAASVAVKEAATVVVTVPLLVLCGWLSGVSASRLSLLPRGNVLAVLLVVAVAITLLAILPPTRRLLRRRLEPLLQRTVPQLLASASDPRRVTTAIAGILLLDGGYVLALDASLRAFSASLALPALVVVYLAASALGSAAPTPGGLGAVEAALVGGLTATGVPFAPALTAVLAFRTVTFWLPAPLGWGALLALQRAGRV